MSKAIALARNADRDGADLARLVLVVGGSCALILAGQALPF